MAEFGTRNLSTKEYSTEDEIMDDFVQIISGVKRLHEAGICHGQLTADSVFVGGDGQVKVAVVERREVNCDKDVNESFSEESDHPATCQFLQGTPDDDIQSLAQILC